MIFKLFVSTIIENAGKILLVQEAKVDNRGKWNFPGGHLELGESLAKAAEREVKEETGLEVTVTALVGLYTKVSFNHSFRFVFCTDEKVQSDPLAGDNILAVKWWTKAEFDALTDDELVSPKKLRQGVADYFAGKKFSLEVIQEVKL